MTNPLRSHKVVSSALSTPSTKLAGTVIYMDRSTDADGVLGW